MRKLKWISLLMVISVLSVIIYGCGNSNEIADLQKEISEMEWELSQLEDDLEEWEEIYDDAKSTYDRYKYSSDPDIQEELERTKDIMDEARKERDAIEREISLLELSKKHAEDRLNSLLEE